jgi:hypothetical protein
MFWTIKCSSSGILHKQLYGILSCIYISSQTADMMYLILKKYNFYFHILGIYIIFNFFKVYKQIMKEYVFTDKL